MLERIKRISPEVWFLVILVALIIVGLFDGGMAATFVVFGLLTLYLA